MDNNRYILNELNKGLKMGMDSIPMFLKKFKMIDLNKI